MSRLKMIARRGFLIGSPSVVGGAVFGAYKYQQPHVSPLPSNLPEGASEITPYVRIDAQGITIITPRAEMGQGSHRCPMPTAWRPGVPGPIRACPVHPERSST